MNLKGLRSWSFTGEGLTTGEIAKLAGVKESTIRAWRQRRFIPRGSRRLNAWSRYNVEYAARIVVMARLAKRYRLPEAARLAFETPLPR